MWLFGGYGVDSTGNDDYLNDLWKFNPTTLQWTWVSGSNVRAASGVYGTLGTGSTNNYPGARESMASWIDSSGNFWLFGGLGYDSGGNGGTLNDLWKFNPSNLQWTWMGGSNIVGATGVYGTQGVASSSNFPGARNVSNSWTDKTGNFWLIAGNANDSTGTGDAINDVWKYSPTSNQWTWVSGSNLVNASGVYNTLGVTSLSSVFGARTQELIWHDQRDVTWIFGGVGFDAFGNPGQLNDFWKFAPL